MRVLQIGLGRWGQNHLRAWRRLGYRGMHRFLPTLIRLEGFRVSEVPVGNRRRVHGQSKYGIWNRAFAALRDLFAVRWMRTRVVRWQIAEDTLVVER